MYSVGRDYQRSVRWHSTLGAAESRGKVDNASPYRAVQYGNMALLRFCNVDKNWLFSQLSWAFWMMYRPSIARIPRAVAARHVGQFPELMRGMFGDAPHCMKMNADVRFDIFQGMIEPSLVGQSPYYTLSALPFVTFDNAVHILRYLIAGQTNMRHILEVVVKNRLRDLITWILDERLAGRIDYTFAIIRIMQECAIIYNRPDMIEWFMQTQHELEFDISSMRRYAVDAGAIASVRYLFGSSFPPDPDVMWFAQRAITINRANVAAAVLSTINVNAVAEMLATDSLHVSIMRNCSVTEIKRFMELGMQLSRWDILVIATQRDCGKRMRRFIGQYVARHDTLTFA